jgi:hypothetical protein
MGDVMGMDVWYDVVVQELGDGAPDGRDLLMEAERVAAATDEDEPDDTTAETDDTTEHE